MCLMRPLPHRDLPSIAHRVFPRSLNIPYIVTPPSLGGTRMSVGGFFHGLFTCYLLMLPGSATHAF
jgi:hypothetical protein